MKTSSTQEPKVNLGRVASVDRKETIRLNLEVTPELYKTLTEMADKIHGSTSDVLLRSLALMEVAIEAKEKGEKFGIAHEGQVLAREIVGI